MAAPNDEKEPFEWEADSHLNRFTAEQRNGGGLVLTTAHGPVGRRTQVSLRLPAEATAALIEWLAPAPHGRRVE